MSAPPTRTPPPALSEVAGRWTELGHRDPMWAALTCAGKAGRRDRPSRRDRPGWSESEFLATGRCEIDAMLARLAELGVSPRRGTALDFGCGPGRLTAALATAGFARAIGVDISPSMLDIARRLISANPDTAERCELRLNEGTTLAGMADDSVDLVYTCRVLQHLPPALAHGYLREFMRVTVPGGLVVFQLPVEPAPGVVGTVLRRLPAQALNRLRRGMQMHGTQPTVVTALVAAAGGRTVAIEPDSSAGPRWRSHLYITEAGTRVARDAPAGAPPA
ncbi:MAG: class I SAM-dependent methyltransferase [Actinomycetota bacterium]|nr:class I SAM-dependent methyltransferase [Actinomycetota bacterium]